jgi:pyrophosphatase PpaX
MVKAVILDWDGTLWDVLGFMVEAYTEVFNDLGIEPWSREDFRERFRHDWRDMLGEMGLKDHEGYLIRHWEEKILKERPLTYPWVKEFEEELSKNYRLAVVSSAPKKPLLRELRRNRIYKNLEVVISAEDVENIKPSSEPIEIALEKMGLDAAETVYVGDMVEDVIASKKAKVPVVAVSWGLHSKERLLGENPDFLAESPAEVLDFIDGLP